MKFSSYFIKHPVIAIIINIMIVVIGLLCLKNLSVREYPNIVYPTINVTAQYPNASPEVIESAVTNILEDRLAGVEGVETISSESSAGNVKITLLFTPTTRMDKALSNTQDAVGMARGLLPSEVKTPAVEARQKANGLPFVGVSVSSNIKGFGELTHYANLNFKNVFRSIPGVASVEIWGQPYTYSVKLDQKKLFIFGVNPDDVVSAIQAAKVDLPAGKFRERIPVTLNKELKSKIDFENLIVKNDKNPIRLGDIADISLDTDNSQTRVRVNGKPGVVLSINRTNESNPIEVSKEVHNVVKKLQQELPEDISLKVIIDQSDFINASLKNIESSIVEAIVLVLLIIFIFLRNFSATLIPLVTIPISLIGSLLFLYVLGYSINLMTLLAMVLAIGLVVDDAIIVVENIWRHIENGLSPFQAALTGAREIGFAIIAMTLTLASVYIPIAFVPGMLGQLFIEFAVALAGSVFISGIVALTLSPLMCSKLLSKRSSTILPSIDLGLDKLSKIYLRVLNFLTEQRRYILILAIFSIIGSLFFYQTIRHETAPREDRSLMGVFVPPNGSENIDDLEGTIKHIEKDIMQISESDHHLTFMGDWGASLVIPLKPLTLRKNKAFEIVERLKPKVENYPSVDPHVWSWDMALPGLSNAGSGSRLNLVISTTEDYRSLYNHMQILKKKLEESQKFSNIHFDLSLDTFGYVIDIDTNQAAKLGLKPQQVAKAIEIYFSGDKNLNLEKDGIAYDITIKGSRKPWSLDELYLTTPENHQVSLSAIAKMVPQAQPATLTHFQQMRSTNLYVNLKEDQSVGKGAKKLWRIAKENLPEKYKLTWHGAVKSFNESSSTMIFLLILSIVFIYAILAIQFESYLDPLIILCTVPLAFVGSLAFLYIFNQSLNIYSQVGLITLIGLISKHGILMVEFANQLYKKGSTYKEAIKKAAALRLRPILMTSSAMMLGAIPLILSSDAGSEARHAIGIVLVSGLFWGTLFTLFILPTIYETFKSYRK